nr:villin-4-like [Ipomoea batatas]GMC63319.1 villin-4-like [Ipomoea batatas]GMC64897.1 villin-4-like [Ipomoea batatas]GMC68524.1 villin-4-like [Ipomoea batatas]
MTEDIFILDCHSDIYIWVGQQVEYKTKMQALAIGEKFLEHDFLLEKLSRQAPIYIVMEGSEPPFFTRFFTWDSEKSAETYYTEKWGHPSSGESEKENDWFIWWKVCCTR